MSGTISQQTHERRKKHQETVEELDKQFKPYALHFLLGLPDHSSMLTNELMTQGIQLGIRQARVLLKLINHNTHSLQAINNHLKTSGEELIK